MRTRAAAIMWSWAPDRRSRTSPASLSAGRISRRCISAISPATASRRSRRRSPEPSRCSGGIDRQDVAACGRRSVGLRWGIEATRASRATVGKHSSARKRHMDVGMMMVFASYGWDACPDDQVWDEEIRLARLAADFGVRRAVVGRASLQRLFLRAGQPAPDVLPRGRLPGHELGHGGRHPALARSAARGRERRRCGPAVQGQAPARHGPGARPARVRGLQAQHG